MQGLPKTSQGRASYALRMIAQAQHDSSLLATKVFSLLFEGSDGNRVLYLLNQRLEQDADVARVALSPVVCPYLDASTLTAAQRAQAEDVQGFLFPWLEEVA